MRRRISIRGCVHPPVRPSVRPSVRRSVTPSLRRQLGASYAEYSALFYSRARDCVGLLVYLLVRLPLQLNACLPLLLTVGLSLLDNLSV